MTFDNFVTKVKNCGIFEKDYVYSHMTTFTVTGFARHKILTVLLQ